MEYKSKKKLAQEVKKLKNKIEDQKKAILSIECDIKSVYRNIKDMTVPHDKATKGISDIERFKAEQRKLSGVLKRYETSLSDKMERLSKI